MTSSPFLLVNSMELILIHAVELITSIADFLLLSYVSCMDVWYTLSIYSPVDAQFGCGYFFANVNKTVGLCVKINSISLLDKYLFNGSMIAEPFVKCRACVFNFLIMCLTVFPGCAILHLHQPHMDWVASENDCDAYQCPMNALTLSSRGPIKCISLPS